MFNRSNIHNQFKAFRKGSESACNCFFELYEPRIYDFLLRKVRNMAVATELTEKVFTIPCVHHQRIETVAHLLAVLYHYARKCGNRCLLGIPCIDESEWQEVPPA